MKNSQKKATGKTGRDRPGASGMENVRHTAMRFVCRRYCAYFKGFGGEDGCGGFSAVSRAMASGMVTVVQLERVLRRAPVPPERVKVLKEKLCMSCGYLRDACDFQSPAPPEDATPCGGYRLFLALLESGEITAEEMEKILEAVQRSMPGIPGEGIPNPQGHGPE